MQEHDAETSAEAAEAAKELSELLSKAAMERNKTDNDLVNLGNLVDQPNVEGRGQGQLSSEAAKELVTSGESGLLSKAATQAAMEHIRTKSVRVNLHKLQPKVEVQGQEVALVSSMRDEGLAAAFTAPSTEGAITRTPGRRHPHGATQMKKATSTRTRGGPATH